MLIKFVDIGFFVCVILTLVCSLRACNMWLTRNHMFIRDIWGKFISFIFWNFEISLVSFGRFQNFEKVNSVNVSQISLLSMWLLVQLFFEVSMMLSLQCSCLFSDVVWEDRRIGGETRHLARWNETKGNTCRRKRATFTSGTSLWMFLSFSLFSKQDIVYGI